MADPAELLARARAAIQLATRAGAQDAWAKTSRNRDVEIKYRDDHIETVQESTTQGLSLRLWVDGRYSTHSTTDLRPESSASRIPLQTDGSRGP